jgi:hypothetical protein
MSNSPGAGASLREAIYDHMQKRHTPAIRLETLEIAPPVNPLGPYLSTAKLKRAAKLRKQLDALKKELAEVLRGGKQATA